MAGGESTNRVHTALAIVASNAAAGRPIWRWVEGFGAGLPTNVSQKRAFRGINALLLAEASRQAGHDGARRWRVASSSAVGGKPSEANDLWLVAKRAGRGFSSKPVALADNFGRTCDGRLVAMEKPSEWNPAIGIRTLDDLVERIDADAQTAADETVLSEGGDSAYLRVAIREIALCLGLAGQPDLLARSLGQDVPAESALPIFDLYRAARAAQGIVDELAGAHATTWQGPSDTAPDMGGDADISGDIESRSVDRMSADSALLAARERVEQATGRLAARGGQEETGVRELWLRLSRDWLTTRLARRLTRWVGRLRDDGPLDEWLLSWSGLEDQGEQLAAVSAELETEDHDTPSRGWYQVGVALRERLAQARKDDDSLHSLTSQLSATSQRPDGRFRASATSTWRRICKRHLNATWFLQTHRLTIRDILDLPRPTEPGVLYSKTRRALMRGGNVGLPGPDQTRLPPTATMRDLRSVPASLLSIAELGEAVGNRWVPNRVLGGNPADLFTTKANTMLLGASNGRRHAHARYRREVPLCSGSNDLLQARLQSLPSNETPGLAMLPSNAIVYRRHPIPKRGGGLRWLDVPAAELSRHQEVLGQIATVLHRWPGSTAAFAPARSPAYHAAIHARARVAVVVDIRDFFGSVRPSHLRRWADHVEKNRDRLLAQLLIEHEESLFCPRDADHEPYLAQGAPSSPVIANLVAEEMDRDIRSVATRIFGAGNFAYSRYADDLVLSTPRPDGRFATIARRTLYRAIRSMGWRPNARKTRVWYHDGGKPLAICGLRVAGCDDPTRPIALRLGREAERRVRALRHRAGRTARLRAHDQGGPLAPGVRGHLAYAYSVTGDPALLGFVSGGVARLAMSLCGEAYAPFFLRGWCAGPYVSPQELLDGASLDAVDSEGVDEQAR